MRDPDAPDNLPDGRPLFTFRSGGWIITLAAIASLALIVWAVAPALMRSVTRPPGDGEHIASYRFDLSHANVDTDLIVPIMLHRDMVPVMTATSTMPGADVAGLNAEQRGKFLVSEDRIIGVELNGETRAYPIKLLNVHEIIHDTLGGEPIAVTYHWPCDSVRVFNRTIEGRPVEFAISGLLYNSNMLFYVKGSGDPNAEDHRPESLWCQLLARAVTGPDAEAGRTLDVVPSQVTSWATWLARHPETTVVTEIPRFHKRYEGAQPSEYFIEDKLIAPVEPLPDTGDVKLKARVVAVRVPGDSSENGSLGRVYPLSVIASRIAESASDSSGGDESVSGGGGEGEGVWVDHLGDVSIRFEAYDDVDRTVVVSIDGGRPAAHVDVIHGFWFAIHAMFPGLPLAQDGQDRLNP